MTQIWRLFHIVLLMCFALFFLLLCCVPVPVLTRKRYILHMGGVHKVRIYKDVDRIKRNQ